MKRQSRVSLIIVSLLVLILLVISLFPFYYMVVQSFLPWDVVDKQLLPTAFTFRSYEHLLNQGGGTNQSMWLRALANSLLVSIPTAVISVACGLWVGYSVTKLKKFKGKNFILNTLLFQMFFPTIILLVPRYMIARPLANTYTGMVIPLAISVWANYMYINYFKSIPDALIEAAEIEGAGHFRIIRSIAFPIAKAVTTIVFLSIFMQRWGELMWDMLISPSVDMQTLNVLISTQFKPMGAFPGPMYAASVILTIPIIVLFLMFSKYFKDGISFMLK